MTPTKAVRRSVLLLAPLLAIVSLVGCSATSDSVSGGNAGSSSWSFTDDTGKTVTLDHQPKRIASYADYALGLLSTGVKPVAVFGRVAVASDDRFADYDISSTAIVGNSYGEIDLEKLAEAAPDLIVAGVYPTDRKGTINKDEPYYSLADKEQQTQLEKIAPIVAIKVGGKGSDVITSVNKLATALGADPDTIAAAKKKYDSAAADLRAAAAQTKLEVTQMYADADGVYVVKPGDEPETELYRSLGVKFTDLHPDGEYYWDKYSWENAAQMMTGDVLLVNVEGFQKKDLLDQATFASSPALKTGQIHAWNSAALDYASQAKHITELAKILRDSKNV
ncbi:ABC transporter substrate-binding protein [Lacisediminihabitans changchengi]|uniref:ABC transporter substrate-binding protein n=1 Tax=Lacisediminihabitans changchengi TaxID=2787634 RepID=A0A934SM70_9MICO|nr:ABC transporter substrate-binding protein [Lacisediminihabitans changchengi]MBK4346958.1 ABC transporter substrate-binding protein [Lacisediminihabitans changchengi]MBK4347919.1 ABC transporter substrate-binding protein [Lacisediminihabitans changchengi]